MAAADDVVGRQIEELAEAANSVSTAWWRERIPAFMLARMCDVPGIILRLPMSEPENEGAWIHYCSETLRRWNSGGSYYIGITGDPVVRWRQHEANGFSVMMIMMVATKSKATAAVERGVIKRWCSLPSCSNAGPGGEGASSASPHFLYVVSRPDFLIRRRGSNYTSASTRSGSGPARRANSVHMGSVLDELYFGYGPV